MPQHEYFVVAKTFGAPFFPDTLTDYVVAGSARQALAKFLRECTHPSGVSIADAFYSADDYHRGRIPIAVYRSNQYVADHLLREPREGAIYDRCPTKRLRP